jgi:hypothetical protein
VTIGNLAVHSPFLRMIIGDADEAMAQTGRMLTEARDRGFIDTVDEMLDQMCLFAGSTS